MNETAAQNQETNEFALGVFHASIFTLFALIALQTLGFLWEWPDLLLDYCGITQLAYLIPLCWRAKVLGRTPKYFTGMALCGGILLLMNIVGFLILTNVGS